jgi:phospholipid/cholesterol/gamma-HCH transport system substrate-binding protein
LRFAIWHLGTRSEEWSEINQKLGIENRKSPGRSAMNKKIEIIVGTFFFVGLAALLLMIFSVVPWIGKKFTYTAVFDHGGGLRKGDLVMMRGVPIGDVQDMGIQEDGMILVTFRVEDKWAGQIHDKLTAEVSLISLLGGHCIQLYAPTDSEGRIVKGEPLAPGQRIKYSMKTVAMSDLFVTVSDVAGRLKNQLDPGGDLHTTFNNIRKITDDMEAGRGMAGKMLKDDKMAEDLVAAVANVKTTSENAKIASDDIKLASAEIKTVAKEVHTDLAEGKGLAGMILNDAKVRDQVAQIIGDLSAASKKLNEGEGPAAMLLNDKEAAGDIKKALASLRGAIDNFDKLMVEARTGQGFVARMLTDKDLADSLAASVENLKDITDKANNGAGTLARVINDPTVYNELKGMLSGAREAIDAAREAAPIASFASMLIGALR